MQRINSFAGVTWLDDQLTNEKLRIVKNIDCILMHVQEVYVGVKYYIYDSLSKRADVSLYSIFRDVSSSLSELWQNYLIFIKITTPFIKLQGFSSLSPILVAF